MAQHRAPRTPIRLPRPPRAAAAVIALAVVAGAFSWSMTAATADTPSIQSQCQTALSFTGRTAADKTWLKTCVHALTPPTVTPTPSGSSTATPPPTPTATPTATPTPVPTSPTPIPTPSVTDSPSPSPSPTPSQTPAAWPHPGDGVTGVPPGWVPAQVFTGTTANPYQLIVSTPGQVIENIEIDNGDIQVHAPNVTIRNVRIVGGGIGNWWDPSCDGIMTLDHISILGAGPTLTFADGGPVIGRGNYVASHILIDGVTEGFRVGESTPCSTPSSISDSFVRIITPIDCTTSPFPDWHGDGLQGYLGAGLTLTHTTLRMNDVSTSRTPCEGTSPLFWPNQGNGSIHVNGVLAIGGAYYAVRIATPGDVHGLLVMAAPNTATTSYGGVLIDSCAQLTTWDAHWASVDLTSYTATPGAAIPCG
jgi:hypothetical protein